MSILLRSYPLLVILFSLYAAPAFSEEEGSASISSPTDGSTIKAMARNKLVYAVHGANVFHGRLYIDGKKTVLLRKPNGKHNLAKLSAGNHEICVKALTKSHKEVGNSTCVKVTAQ